MPSSVWPQSLVPSAMTLTLVDNSPLYTSPTTGTTRTSSLYGGIYWKMQLVFSNVRGTNRQAAINFLSYLRGRAGRVFVSDVTQSRLGSFPTSELLQNANFSSLAGWSPAADAALTQETNAARITRIQATGGNNGYVQQSVSGLTLYAPYCARVLWNQGRGAQLVGVTMYDAVAQATLYGATSGMYAVAYVAQATSGAFRVDVFTGGSAGVSQVGDYFSVQYASLSRCALADGGVNYLTYSDDFATGWSASACALTSTGAYLNPDGTSGADVLVEDGTTAQHYGIRTVTVPAAVGDWCLSIAVHAHGRQWVELGLRENTGNTYFICGFNLSAGTTGQVSFSGNWANGRSFISPLGNGWYQCTIIARKTNAATSLAQIIYASTGDNTTPYAGFSGASLGLWRATLAPSSNPVRLSATDVGANLTGTNQIGSAIYLKGLPASVNDLLKAGDYFEIFGEVKRCTAHLNSDADGRGYLTFEPRIGSPLADGAPVVINNPLFKMISEDAQASYSTAPGNLSDFTINLREARS